MKYLDVTDCGPNVHECLDFCGELGYVCVDTHCSCVLGHNGLVRYASSYTLNEKPKTEIHTILKISRHNNLKARNKAMIRNRYNQIPYLTEYTILESDKKQENITYKRAKGSARSQQKASRLQRTRNKV